MNKLYQKFGIPIDTINKFEEKIVKSKPFVYWGKDNMFVNELYDLMDYSPIHNACLRSKIDNIVGQGFVNNYKVSDKDTLNDVFRDMVFDYVITGNIFLEVVWKKDRTQGLSGLYYVPSKYMRVGVPDDDDYTITKFYYSKDWTKRNNTIIEFGEFDPKNYENRQIVHIRDRNPGYYAYGAPQYLSVINDIKLNHEITIYNLANLVNGANPSLWVHFADGQPQTEEEERALLRRLEERYEGSTNAGKMIVSFSDGQEGKPEITQISSNLQQGFYEEVFTLVQRQILSGHKIPDGSLIGLPSPSGFNSQAELLETAHKLFLNTTIIPTQNFLIRELQPLIELINKGEIVELKINQNNII